MSSRDFLCTIRWLLVKLRMRSMLTRPITYEMTDNSFIQAPHIQTHTHAPTHTHTHLRTHEHIHTHTRVIQCHSQFLMSMSFYLVSRLSSMSSLFFLDSLFPRRSNNWLYTLAENLLSFILTTCTIVHDQIVSTF